MNEMVRMITQQALKTHALQSVPVIDNLYFFNESDIFAGKILEEKVQKIEASIQNANRYTLFLAQKGRRPIYDIYACFQPFNEASKALYPFLKKLQAQVKPGDVILNLWDRTGWMTNLLAGLFPEQQIITTWEGNKDVLGYSGFHFWMKAHPNIRVLFCDLNLPLPFLDDSIAFSVGLDALHRFNKALLLPELMRVVQNGGAILFPHVHLSNAEPEPYFVRGGKLMHGREYDEAFQRLAATSETSTNETPTNEASGWQGFVFSEPDLFVANDISVAQSIPIISNPNTPDYNALIALLPPSWASDTLSAFSLADIKNLSEARILVNSLLNINLHQQKVTIDFQHLDGEVGHLFERHPIYVKRIEALHDFALSEQEAILIFLAQKGFTVQEIAAKMRITQDALVQHLQKLEVLGLLQVLPISADAHRLQHYLMSQQYNLPPSQQHLKALWRNAVALFSENTALISMQDGSELTYLDCDELVNLISAALQSSGLRKGDKILICSTLHIEAVLLFWACMQIGVVVVPIGTHLPIETIAHIQAQTEAAWCFINQAFYEANPTCFSEIEVVLFDEEEESADELYFANWLHDGAESIRHDVPISQHDEAVILFTSGSTGIPKGVQLSHGHLCQSGRLITETFHWTDKDRFFALGGLESMSGLRNAAIAPLHVGASVFIPQAQATQSMLGIAEAIAESGATIMGSNPALLRQFVKYADKVSGQLSSIQTWMCTGNVLQNQLRDEFQKTYRQPILNYYGLTETTGICIAQNPLDIEVGSGIETIGKPIDCIAQIVDEQGNLVPVGAEGELRIFSENIMRGYFRQPKATDKVLRNGWFYTQDLAKYTETGEIQLLGRKRNIIKTATEDLVYLDDIQDLLQSQESVEDVAVCAYREEDAEKMAIFAVLKEATLPQQEALKQRFKTLLTEKMGAKKVPHRIHFLPKLPYSDHGKLLKHLLLNELHEH